MGITSGTQLDLQSGATEKIIEDDEADRSYIVEVVGDNAVRVDHRKQYAADGTTLSAGQSHIVSNLRGKQLFAAAYDGATAIRVRLAAADVTSQPERNVSVVDGDVNIASSIDIDDRAGREIGKARMMDSGGVLINPATDETISSELSREIATWSAGTLSVSIEEAQTTGIRSFSYSLNGGNETLPNNAVPAGVSVVVQAEPTNAESLRVGEPSDPVISLAPSGTITYDVTNTNQIGVNGAANDTVNVTYEVN